MFGMCAIIAANKIDDNPEPGFTLGSDSFESNPDFNESDRITIVSDGSNGNESAGLSTD